MATYSRCKRPPYKRSSTAVGYLYKQIAPAGVMELVDVVDSKSTAGDSVPVRVRSPAPKKLNPCRGWAFFMSTEREPEARVRGAGRAPPGADAARSASGSGQNFASKCAQEILGTATRTTGTKRKSHPKGWLFLLVLCGHSAEPAVRSAALQKCDTFWGYRIFYCSLGAYFVVFCRGACYYVKLGYCAFQTERNVWIWALSKL